MSTEGNPTNPAELSDEDQFAEYLKQAEEAEQAEPEPEPEQEPETPAEPAPVAAQTQAQPAADDWLAQVPDDVRERVRQEIEIREKAARDFENRWKAQTGQLGPVQRKLADTERQLREATQRQAQQKPAGMSESAWLRYKREFAEESQAIEEFVNPLIEELADLKEWRKTREASDEEVTQEREFNAAAQQLAKEHPDWQELDNDPVFGEWFDAQPDVVKEMFPEGQKASPKHVAWLVGEFKKAEKMAELWEKSQQPAPAQASPKAQAAVARREQQKRDPITAFKTGQSAPTGRRNATGDSEEDAFAAYLAENPP